MGGPSSLRGRHLEGVHSYVGTPMSLARGRGSILVNPWIELDYQRRCGRPVFSFPVGVFSFKLHYDHSEAPSSERSRAGLILLIYVLHGDSLLMGRRGTRGRKRTAHKDPLSEEEDTPGPEAPPARSVRTRKSNTNDNYIYEHAQTGEEGREDSAAAASGESSPGSS
jgi:hypothetical protein